MSTNPKSVASLTNKLTVLTLNQVIEREAEAAAQAVRQKIFDKYKEGSPERVKKEKSLVLVPLMDTVAEADAALSSFLDGYKEKKESLFKAVALAKAVVSKKAQEVGIDDPYRARNTTGGKSKVDGDLLFEYLTKEGDKPTKAIEEQFDIKGKQVVRKWHDANGAKFGIYVYGTHQRFYTVKKQS